MSSHREAPEISKDPVADNTDVYAFVSPAHPTYVTLIANFIPLQKPDGGPNFYEFGNDVLYEIKIAGALVVEMPAAMVGQEVEVRRVGGPVPAHLPHVAVVDRPAGDTTVPSLVFGELAEGTYELFPKGGGPVRLTADVRGGAVTEVAWG